MSFNKSFNVVQVVQQSFNDRHGHAAGDLVLRVIAAELRHSFRKTDIVSRYGGEEFVIAMPETDAPAARKKLEGFRQDIANTPIHLAKSGETVHVTISAELPAIQTMELNKRTCLQQPMEGYFRQRETDETRSWFEKEEISRELRELRG